MARSTGPADGGIVPPGWPADLPPPQADEFEQRVVGWLLDRAPGSWRSHAVLRRNPQALARLVGHVQAAQLAGLRSAYAAARRELTDVVAPEDLPAVLAAIEAEGAITAEAAREVTVVTEALAGAKWRRKL